MALGLELISGGIAWERRAQVPLKLLRCLILKVSGICLHVLARSVLSWGVFAQGELVWKKPREAKINPTLICLASN